VIELLRVFDHAGFFHFLERHPMKIAFPTITTCALATLLLGCDGGTRVKVEKPVIQADLEHRDEAGRPPLPTVSARRSAWSGAKP